MKETKTKTRVKLGARVRQLRKIAGLSQEELAFRSGMHRTYVGSIERAEQNVSIDNIHKIAKALKVSPKELLE
ncbi:MAG TPA: helix-turn-helix transcriptional regulator [Candidatus Saccharimonadales bacterium]|nr:helix-turn-helix transcriptional regulator [Candidatus Saccharimonadales bacterium]